MDAVLVLEEEVWHADRDRIATACRVLVAEADLRTVIQDALAVRE